MKKSLRMAIESWRNNISSRTVGVVLCIVCAGTVTSCSMQQSNGRAIVVLLYFLLFVASLITAVGAFFVRDASHKQRLDNIAGVLFFLAIILLFIS